MRPRAETAGADGAEDFVHVGLLFHSPSELSAAAAPLILSAVAEGDHVLVVLDEEPREAVRAALPLLPEEAVRFAPPASFYDAPGRTLAALHRLSLPRPRRRVTVVAQPPLPDDDPLALREWQRLDSVLNSALAGAWIRLLCVHDTRVPPPPVLDAVLLTHPVVATGDGPRPNTRYRDPVELSADDAATPLPPPTGRVEHVDITPDLTDVRSRVARTAAALEVPAALTGDLVVAVNEMAANVLEHGTGKGVISLWRPDGHVVCDVLDEGGSLTDPLSGYHPNDTLSVRGYGLWITRQVCDFMEVRGDPRGSVVRLHFRIPESR
ncbi:anti-sigma factor RsbA family regulatory protein [Actinorugispora endophytica]|uniref:Anti-sigma regulatory factor (Ser/Thr protein kinase) n=1 Tax=Actinorugispora endophytica TaxID=1605990 RepID=A0A4R6V4F9_9ACTN|nr:anti-sigma factor RsbA family regulatory protein [Actinorugispora endophytica]TDQ55073.1 anti-sigma regulatory factor (Ser/Thr protein kinase) [Actinorugispora endophytica]